MKAKSLALVNGRPTEKSQEVLTLLAKIHQGKGQISLATAENMEILAFENDKGRNLSTARIQANQRMAEMYIVKGDYAEAKRLVNGAIELVNRAYGPNSPALFDSCLCLAEIETEQGNLQEASKMFDWLAKAKPLADRTLEGGGARYIKAQAAFSLASGNVQRAERLARDAL